MQFIGDDSQVGSVFIDGLYSHPQEGTNEDLFMIPCATTILFACSVEMAEQIEPGYIMWENAYKRSLPYYGVAALAWMNSSVFTNLFGLTVADLYLTVAECELRDGKINQAMASLDKIREKHVNPSVYTPWEGNVTTEDEAIKKVKLLTREESIFSIRNFLSVKRWTVDSKWKETVRKTINGTTYELRPESPLWVFPFPQNAIGLNPTLTQNY